jgi:flagellar protein FliT
MKARRERAFFMPVAQAGPLAGGGCRKGERSRRSFRERPGPPAATMRRMPSQIEMYQDMSTLSARMVAAARARDWDTLIGLERAVAALRDRLMALDDNASLSEAELGLKADLIRRILDDDAEIRRHTEPWMERVRQFLGDRRRRPAAEPAGGASSPG